MNDLQIFLKRITDNLLILQEQKNKYGNNAPAELLDQIEDHQKAITLIRQAQAEEIGLIEWAEAIQSLLVNLDAVTGGLIRVTISSHIAQAGPGSTIDVAQRSVPLQRPPRSVHFTGRQKQLAQLLNDLQPGRAITLCGPGGIGKSALVAEAIWMLAPDDAPPEVFPDGIIFHNFYHRPQADLVLGAITRAYRETPKPTPFDAARRALAGRKALVVLEGTEEADNLDRVLGVAGDCGILMTSRKREAVFGERKDIEPLPTDEAVKLLQAWGKEQVDDVRAAKEIVDLMDGLPLAVCLAGSYLDQAKENAADYLKWLEVSLESLKHSERQHEIVPLLLKRSLAQVSDQARQALAVTGLLALLASFDREVVAAGLGFEPGQAESWLRELVNYGLLLRRDDRYEASHVLIHGYARERGELPDEVVTRLAGYYDALTREQRELGPIGYARLDNDRAHMMAVLAACAEQELWEAARDLVWAVDDYLDICGYRIEQVLTLEIGVKAAQELGNRGDEGAVLGKLGNAYRYLGQMDRAIESHQQALAVYRKLGDRRGEGSSLGNLGLVYCDLGQGDRAIEYHQQALIIQRKINDRHGESISLGNLGLAYSTLGQMQRAIEFYQLALVVQREIGDPSSKTNWF